MFSRAISIGFVGALLVCAATGCGDGGANSGGSGSPYGAGAYQAGGPASGGSSGGTDNSSSGGSSSGTTSSSGSGSGSSSGGSSSGSGSGSGSSSGGSSDAGTTEAGSGPLTPAEAYAQISQCMSYTQFTTKTPYGMAASDVAWQQTSDGATCTACHNTAPNGSNFYANYGTVNGVNQTQTMFNETQSFSPFPYIMTWFSVQPDSNGNVKDIVPANVIVAEGQMQCASGTPCHPSFKLPSAVVSAMSAFVNATITSWHNGTCGTVAGDAGH